jgi:hypothetical protein
MASMPINKYFCNLMNAIGVKADASGYATKGGTEPVNLSLVLVPGNRLSCLPSHPARERAALRAHPSLWAASHCSAHSATRERATG